MDIKKSQQRLAPGIHAARGFRCTALALVVLLVTGLSGCGKSEEAQKAEAAAIEAQTSGRLAIKSNRPDTTIEATLIVPAGEAVPSSRKGVGAGAAEQALARLPAGKYTLTAQSAGWSDITKVVEVAAGGTTEITITFPSGSLRLDSLPSGFTVKQGKTTLGKTPLVIPQLPPGECELTLEAPLWPPMTYKATIAENVETAATARVPHGKLMIDSSPPGAVVVFSGRGLGRTPMTVQSFQAGTNKLTLQSKDFPPLEVTVTMEDGGEVSLHPLLAESFPEMNPEALLRAVWVETKSQDPSRLSPAFSQTINFRPRNGVVKNLDRVKLFENWLEKPYRFTGLVKSYNRESGQIEFAEEKGDLARYRVLATLSPEARGDKDLAAQLAKGEAFSLHGNLNAVEEPKWPVKVITLEFWSVEPVR